MPGNCSLCTHLIGTGGFTEMIVSRLLSFNEQRDVSAMHWLSTGKCLIWTLMDQITSGAFASGQICVKNTPRSGRKLKVSPQVLSNGLYPSFPS